jgi:hypothetical protein
MSPESSRDAGQSLTDWMGSPKVKEKFASQVFANWVSDGGFI